jgi:hypothetical protein
MFLVASQLAAFAGDAGGTHILRQLQICGKTEHSRETQAIFLWSTQVE